MGVQQCQHAYSYWFIFIFAHWHKLLCTLWQPKKITTHNFQQCIVLLGFSHVATAAWFLLSKNSLHFAQENFHKHWQGIQMPHCALHSTSTTTTPLGLIVSPFLPGRCHHLIFKPVTQKTLPTTQLWDASLCLPDASGSARFVSYTLPHYHPQVIVQSFLAVLLQVYATLLCLEMQSKMMPAHLLILIYFYSCHISTRCSALHSTSEKLPTQLSMMHCASRSLFSSHWLFHFSGALPPAG